MREEENKPGQKLRWRDIKDSPEYARFRAEMLENEQKRKKAHITFGASEWVGLLFLSVPLYIFIMAYRENPHAPFKDSYILTQTPLGGYFWPLFIIGMCVFCSRSWHYEWYVKWIYFYKKWSYVYRVAPGEVWATFFITLAIFVIIVLGTVFLILKRWL